MKPATRYSLRFTGLVQGVGFRPLLAVTARQMGLKGFVYNDSKGVYAELEGSLAEVQQFVDTVKRDKSPLARIDAVELHELAGGERCKSEEAFVATYDSGDAATDTPGNTVTNPSIDTTANVSDNAFTILPSPPGTGNETFIAPDSAPCADCLRELTDPADRRYRYSFINCTNCGPRYTIIKAMPYDRASTTMKAFPMCTECQSEYENMTNCRYHAEPNACADCGPSYSLYNRRGELVSLTEENLAIKAQEERESGPSKIIADQLHRESPSEKDAFTCKDIVPYVDVFTYTADLIRAGHIVAIKGIGGYHLVCDAANEEAVKELRRRKARPHKPLAVMAGSLAAAQAAAVISDKEKEILTSPARPIVLLTKKNDTKLLAEAVAPDNAYVGIMLPYAPVHYLLLQEHELWVMTSGNQSGEPVIYEDEEAFNRLASIADYFLVHNRQIYAPADDSVAAEVEGDIFFYRRSRGYVPLAIPLQLQRDNLPRNASDISLESSSSPGAAKLTGTELPSTLKSQSSMALQPDVSVFAAGSDLKNAFLLTKGNQAFSGPHIGDLANASVNDTYNRTEAHFEKLFDIKPSLVAVDKHPNYYSSAFGRDYAAARGLPLLEVQHHHAHIAAVMAEYGLQGPVLGIALDGTGYGDDGNMWGGEFLLCHKSTYRRLVHFAYEPLPGGEAAVREPWRQALWYLRRIFGYDEWPKLYMSWQKGLPEGWQILDRAMRRRVESQTTGQTGKNKAAVRSLPMPLASSAGRLFDAVGCMLGLGYIHSFDGQIAMALEQLGEGEKGKLLDFSHDGEVLNFYPLVQEIAEQYSRGVPRQSLAASFHRTLAYGIAETAESLLKQYEVEAIALGGGIFQNRRLLRELRSIWPDEKFLLPRQLPVNDGGLALGQAWIALQSQQ